MVQFFDHLDPAFVFLVVLPVGVAIAAWALQMACKLAAVDPPDYWQCMLCIVLVAIANVVLRYWINVSVPDPGLGYRLLLPLGTTAAIVAIMVRVGPVSAVVVTVCEGAICAGIYIGASMVGSALVAGL
jgi:uncharacterized membrane protein YwzB